jgi:chromosome segregation ATPase
LAETEKEVADLKHKLQHYEKDKDSLRIIKARLLVLDEQFRTLSSEYDQLQRKFGTVQHERDMLQETFEQTLEWVRQRNAQSHQRIQERLDDVQGRVEQKSAQLSEVMRAGQLDEVVLRNVTDKLESVLTAKNQHNKHLQLEVARVQKAHDDLIRTYEARLVDLGIPESERNILAPRTNLTAAPAGLI